MANVSTDTIENFVEGKKPATNLTLLGKAREEFVKYLSQMKTQVKDYKSYVTNYIVDGVRGQKTKLLEGVDQMQQKGRGLINILSQYLTPSVVALNPVVVAKGEVYRPPRKMLLGGYGRLLRSPTITSRIKKWYD